MAIRRGPSRAYPSVVLAIAAAFCGGARADVIGPGQLNEMVQEGIGDLMVQSLAILNNIDSNFSITYDSVTQGDAWTTTFGGQMLGEPVIGSLTGTIAADPTWSFTQGSLSLNGTPYSFSGSINVGASNNISVDFTMSNTVGTMKNSIVWSQNGNSANPSMVGRDNAGNLVYTSYIQQMQNGKNPVYYRSMITLIPGGAPDGRDRITSTLTRTNMAGTPIPGVRSISDRGVAEATSDTSFDGDGSSEITSVPEPSSVVLCGIGVLGLVAGRRLGRRRRSR